jgi:hypothetical protein
LEERGDLDALTLRLPKRKARGDDLRLLFNIPYPLPESETLYDPLPLDGFKRFNHIIVGTKERREEDQPNEIYG